MLPWAEITNQSFSPAGMLHIESEIVPKKEYSSTVMTVFKPVFLADIYGMENGFFSNPLFVVTARFYPAVQKLCCKIKSISNNTLVKKKKKSFENKMLDRRFYCA